MANASEVTIKDRSDLEEAFDELADINTALNRKEGTRDKAVRRAKREHKPRIDELTERLTALTKAVEAYCRLNAEQLQEEAGSKTLKLISGEIQYRTGRETVVFDDSKDEVIERLRNAGLDHLINKKISVSKRTLMKHREEIEAIKGVRVERGEEQIKLKPA